MIKHARTRSVLDALRQAVDAGDYERATALMQSYDRHLRELAADTETARESLQQLLEEQHLVIEQFSRLRDQAREELGGMHHAGYATLACLH